MKKFLSLLLIAALAACNTMNDNSTPAGTSAKGTVNPALATKDLRLGCFAVKGVKDSTQGKIYYTSSHHLYKYVELNTKQGDKGFCTVKQAEDAGFKPASEHFSNGMYDFVQCLHSEGNGGTCHDYVNGVYKSLQIYDKVCASGNPSKAELADVVEAYANKQHEGMDVSKYDGTSQALLHKYPCR